MTRAIAAFTILAGAVFAQLRPGSSVPDFTFYDLSGKAVSFADARGETTVVAFISAECPVSNAFNSRMSRLYSDYSGKGVKFVFLNSNVTESADEVKKHAAEAGFPFGVYKDRDSTAAILFGAQSTPETYVIDAKGVVRYHGYIEDHPNEARAKTRGLRNALDAVLAGGTPPVVETKAFGCTIRKPKAGS
jgi:peroxiredoxin